MKANVLESKLGAKKSEYVQEEKVVLISYKNLITGKHQYRDKGKTPEEIQTETEILAGSIELAGAVIDPVIVRDTGKEPYEIISGHTRVRACKHLVEHDGQQQFAMVPCILKKMTDRQAELNTVIGNSRKPTTPLEIFHEIEIQCKNIDQLDPTAKGRTRERIAKNMGISPSAVWQYLSISKGLVPEGIQLFLDGNLKKAAAYTLSTLPEQEQRELLGKGIYEHYRIEEYKKNKKMQEDAESENEKAIEEATGDTTTNKPAKTSKKPKRNIAAEMYEKIETLGTADGEDGYVKLSDVLEIVKQYM